MDIIHSPTLPKNRWLISLFFREISSDKIIFNGEKLEGYYTFSDKTFGIQGSIGLLESITLFITIPFAIREIGLPQILSSEGSSFETAEGVAVICIYGLTCLSKLENTRATGLSDIELGGVFRIVRFSKIGIYATGGFRVPTGKGVEWETGTVNISTGQTDISASGTFEYKDRFLVSLSETYLLRLPYHTLNRDIYPGDEVISELKLGVDIKYVVLGTGLSFSYGLPPSITIEELTVVYDHSQILRVKPFLSISSGERVYATLFVDIPVYARNFPRDAQLYFPSIVFSRYPEVPASAVLLNVGYFF
jgi:hypothetical protein